MYAIVTPTFIGHFQFIKPYLESFERFLKDPENVVFYFTISKNEEHKFQKIIKPYKNLNIKILIFEDILQQFGIKQTPLELLFLYKKFSFQTLKKFYTMLYIPERYSLVLDSESMAINSFSAEELFENFFKAPFVSGSDIKRRYFSDFTNAVNQNINLILNENIPYWFLENFVWFYDKKILEDLFNQYGTPLEIVQKVYQEQEKNIINQNVGVFEIELYQAYVWKNLKKYNYSFYDVNEMLKIALTSEKYQDFMLLHAQKYNGNCGLLERITDLLPYISFDDISQKMHNSKFNIIRCDKTDLKLYPLQKQFLEIVQPCILAASQEHCFGINNTWQHRLKLMLFSSKPFEKLKKHFLRFVEPFRKVINWIFEPFSILYYFIKVLFKICKNFRMIIGG